MPLKKETKTNNVNKTFRNRDEVKFECCKITLKKGDNSQNELETEGNFFKLIEHFKNQDTYNVNLKKEAVRYIVNHRNELRENLITDIPFSVSEIKKCINKLKMKKKCRSRLCM
jgi:hypothetical protein